MNNPKGKAKGTKTAVPGGCGAPRTRKPSERQVRYLEARAAHPEWSVAKCKRAAGFSDRCGGPKIDSRIEGHEDLTRRIRLAQQASGFGVESNLKRLQRVVNRKGAGHDRDAIAAIKVGSDITGERMPEQINVSILSDDEILSKLLD